MRSIRKYQCVGRHALSLLAALFSVAGLYAQKTYTTNNSGHSHNDYEQQRPFHLAYEQNFGSIEIDVFLIGDELYVAHSRRAIDSSRTIEKLYLEPMLEQFKRNRGRVYPDDAKLQFLIDLKTEGGPTLRCLEKKLKPYRSYFDVKNNPHAVKLVISGNMPPPEHFQLFDEIFYFDGRPQTNYAHEQLPRVGMFSAPLRQFSRWDGTGEMPAADYARVKTLVDSVHGLNKKMRFWGTPNTTATWQTFMKMGADYINTDAPKVLRTFLDSLQYLHSPQNTAPAATDNVLTKQEIAQGWKLLFNGKDAGGWEHAGKDVPPEEAWNVRNGVLGLPKTITGRRDDLVSTDEYSDFELSVDFNLSEGGNSGIKYFCSYNERGGWLGFEYQLLDNDRHPDAKRGRDGNRTLGSLYDLFAPSVKPEARMGVWNTARIVVKGSLVEHYVNGVKVLSYHKDSGAFREAIGLSKFKRVNPPFWEVKKGHILLQDHGDEVYFKNIKIKAL